MEARAPPAIKGTLRRIPGTSLGSTPEQGPEVGHRKEVGRASESRSRTLARLWCSRVGDQGLDPVNELFPARKCSGYLLSHSEAFLEVLMTR